MRRLVVPRSLVEDTGVGASEVGAMMGCDPWTTPLQLYRRKLHLDPPRPASEAMVLGQLLEGPVVDLARRRIPLTIRRNHLTWQYPASRLFATPDAFVGQGRLLECKVVGLRSADAFDDELPCRVKLQVQAQLFVTGRHAAYVAQLVGTELRLTLLEADPAVQVEILNAVDRFVQLLDTQVPPDPLTWDERWADLIARLSPIPERDVLAGGAVQEAGARILEIRQLQRQLEDEVDGLRVELLETLVDEMATRILGTGWTAKLQESAGRTDWRAVALEVLELVDLSVDPELRPDDVLAGIVDRHRSSSSATLVVRSSSRDV